MNTQKLDVETQRVVLRRPRLSDVDELSAIYADPQVMRYIGNGATRTREQVEAAVKWMMEQWEQHGFGLYIVEQKHDRQIIGRCGLICQTIEGQPETELAYLLARASWGRGLATEVALAIREHATGTLGMRRLISLVHPDNTASKRVALKAGLGYERTIDFSGQPVEVFGCS